jgi:phytoene synthase
MPEMASDPVALAWADARARFNIPPGYAQQLIDGVARDLTQKRYATFAELAEYSYGVASTVGLMAMHIIGFQHAQALPYAVKLGVALQMTNILRDVAEDWQQGRLYLPTEELAAFGLGEDDIAAGVIDDRWRAFMQFQIERNRSLYDESLPGVGLLNADGRFAIAAAGELYRAILSDIDAHDGDVFSRRAHIGMAGKLRRMPFIWWRSRQAVSA